MKLHDIDFSSFSRISQIFPSLKKKELSSNAYGNNEYNYIDFTGRETFDVIEAVRREHKLSSYSLNSVAEHFLKENKVDLPYRELFEILASGNPEQIAKAATYCIGDADLPLKILLKLNMIPNYVEMAKTTHVPISWLLFRGQQCKVFSLIVKAAMKKGYVIPVYEQNGPTYAFKGAKVLNAYTGLYYDPIAGLDFASLYPSIMIAYNMCYSTFIEDKDTMNYVKENNIPYETIEWEEDDNEDYEEDYIENNSSDEEECKKIVVCQKPNEKEKSLKKYSFSFVQYEDKNGNVMENGQRGILGEILLELWQGRKATKKLMKNENDSFTYAVLNGKQLAQKVTMNSMYGFTGADKGILPLKPIAASVTATGRKMIQETSSMAKEKYGAITIYGDSIPGYEIITIQKNNIIKDIKIEEFSNIIEQDWEEYRGFKINDIEIKNKLYKNIENLGYLTYTHKGFKLIKKIIKHDSKKKLYKIKAKDSNGKIHEVIVTEGHSLIKSDGNLLEASKAKLGDKLYEYL
jgi:DNA polymerase delta subunit 1